MNNFFSLEGGEGSGKSTVSKMVLQMLENERIDAIVTREPGGDQVAEQLREIIFANELDMKSEVLLFAAARREHVNTVIKRNLELNKVVICDRYIDSSYAYQTTNGDVGMEEVITINEFVIDSYIPELTFYLKVKPEIALSRINATEREVTRFDKKAMEFHNKVYDNYNKLSELYKQRIVVIDATQSLDDIANEIYAKIKERI